MNDEGFAGVSRLELPRLVMLTLVGRVILG
jgi:hypothetical protein